MRISYWSSDVCSSDLGSLGGVTWGSMALAAPLILVGTIALPLFARHLNALLLGESEAVHLGFPVESSKRAIVVLAALATGTAVAMTGVIGFVGLVVSHLVRLTAGRAEARRVGKAGARPWRSR